MNPKVEHGYIRPLDTANSRIENTRTENAQASDNSGSAHQLHTGPSHSYPDRVGEGTPSAGGRSESSSPNRMAQFQRQSKGPSAAYQAGFNALMPPNKDRLNESGLDQNELNQNDRGLNGLAYTSLTAMHRVYPKQDSVFLLSAENLIGLWLAELSCKAQHEQPLLMPVAIHADEVSQSTLDVLSQLHFDINKVAGKYRLQQVPAGCRHLPWIKWFEHLLCASLTTPQSIGDKVVIPNEDIDTQSSAAVWYWLEQQSLSKQWEYIEQFAKVRSINDILKAWGE